MAAPARIDWRGTLKRRIGIVAVIAAAWAAAIEVRLVYLQIIGRADLVALAERQQLRTQAVPPKRGDILDRRGRVLATSVDADSIYAVPKEIADPADAAKRLCAALEDCSGKDRQALADKLGQPKWFAYVRRQIAPDQARRVAALGLEGIDFIKESKRFYPNKELAAHLLGYVGIDNTGLDGLEATYDSRIRGKPGTMLVQTDARRHAFSRIERPPTAGSTVELTIDEYLQHIVERELHTGVLVNRAEAGSAIIVDPRTGEILAMANEPTFNPNAYRDVEELARRNRAVQDVYEPGSTFKVVTGSAAIEEKVMAVDTMIDTNPGRLVIDRSRVITDDAGHNNGVLSFAKVIIKSSNIGAVKIGFRVGTERLSRFVGLYGFGRQVSPDFPGENAGIVWSPEKWTDSALASVSMGYQVAVTPLQMVAAVSSVAHGGEYVEPRVVRAIYHNGVRYQTPTKILRRTVSADTAATLTTIMEGVVAEGTAKRAQIDGYTIAGKTGTAQKLVNGRYSHSDHYASFVGFLPSRNPALAIVVVIDSPHGPNGDHGGLVAAPIFKNIAEPALRYLGIPPTINPAPPVLVARQAAGSPAPAGADGEPTLRLIVDEPEGTMPDLRGMSAREAVRTLVKLGMIARLAGDGFVVAQDPAAGTPLEAEGVCKLVLERAPAPAHRTVDESHQ